jgi:ferredoxin, 2Fe-2S
LDSEEIDFISTSIHIIMELLADRKKATIIFKVNNFGEEKIIQTQVGEYRNLMVLLNENFYLESFGECKGMGRCCTCVVEIKTMENCLVEMQRNEATALSKSGIHQSGIRLACQIVINDELNNAEVTISSFE